MVELVAFECLTSKTFFYGSLKELTFFFQFTIASISTNHMGVHVHSIMYTYTAFSSFISLSQKSCRVRYKLLIIIKHMFLYFYGNRL